MHIFQKSKMRDGEPAEADALYRRALRLRAEMEGEMNMMTDHRGMEKKPPAG